MSDQPSLMYEALSGFLAQLEIERDRYKQRAKQDIAAVQAEFPDWTPRQSSGYIAATQARADTMTMLIYRLRRLRDQVGYR